MDYRPIRVGIIGYGLMGRRHARVYTESGLCEVVAVADISENLRDLAVSELGCSVYADFRDLILKSDVDVVSICLPDSGHFEAMKMAISAGTHILVEKPLTTDLCEGVQLVEMAEKTSAKIMVGHLLRFDPRYFAIRSAIDAGEIGDLISISALRSSPITGPLRYGGEAAVEFHVAIHDIDLCLWYANDEVEEVYAAGVSKALRHLDVYDSVFTTLKFNNGAIASIESSWVLPTTYPATLDSKMRVVGNRGAVIVDTYHQGVLLATADKASVPDTMRWTEVEGRATGILREEILHFINCIRSDSTPLIGVKEAYESVKIACAVRRSLETGMPVSLKDF